MTDLASRIQRTSNSGLDKLFSTGDKQEITFSAGFPDHNLFPEDALNESMKEAFAQKNPKLIQYNSAAGLPSLRKKIAAKMQRDEKISCRPENVMVTQGAQQAIDLTARLLLNKNDGLVVEGPTYIGALAAFQAYEPTFYQIPVEEDGMKVSELEKILSQHQVKMIYTVPDFHNPTGTVMSEKKRRQLVELADRYDVTILEDGTYRDLRYEGKNLPTIKSLDTHHKVIYVSSFSKVIAPGLRMGWLTADKQIFDKLIGLKSGADIETSNLMMSMVDNYLENNDFQAHLQKVRAVYREKKNAMIDALAKSLPAEAEFTRPQGGFFIYLTMPKEFDMEKFLNEKLLPEKDVRITPSTHLFASGDIKNGARLNFTGEDIPQIKKGIESLGQALHEVSAKNLVS
ncbi:PLP-dependent aminotransferase family protein [Oenococcus alcoholitolerans]|uniref:aminotransferase-like domain-containing protein n=1 Tax=Oenococcus alcoholitolerans TaxID=931074 RepID=UPI003F72CF73